MNHKNLFTALLHSLALKENEAKDRKRTQAEPDFYQQQAWRMTAKHNERMGRQRRIQA